MSPWIKHLAFPLRATLVTAVVTSVAISIGLTLFVIGLPAYNKAKNSIQGLWEDLAMEVAESATNRVLLYFQTAPVTLRLLEGLVEENELNVGDFSNYLDICYQTLKENPAFMTVYYSKNDGTFYGVFRIGQVLKWMNHPIIF